MHSYDWAADRPREHTAVSIDNSLCFSVYHSDNQVGLARGGLSGPTAPSPRKPEIAGRRLHVLVVACTEVAAKPRFLSEWRCDEPDRGSRAREQAELGCAEQGEAEKHPDGANVLWVARVAVGTRDLEWRERP